MVKKIGRGLLLLGFSLVALSSANAGLQKKSEETLEALMKEFKTLQKDFQKKSQELLGKYQKLHREAKTDKEKEKIIAEFQTKSKELRTKRPAVGITPKFVKIAKADTKSDVGLKAMVWVVRNNPQDPNVGDFVKAMTEHHSSSKEVIALIPSMVRATGYDPEPLFRKVIETNVEPKVKAQVSLSLAGRLKSNAEQNGNLKDYSDAKELYTSVSKKYGKLKATRGGTYANVCKTALVDFNSPRALGKTVPEIEAEDIDGKTFKLSDYRGKVVVIDFWGDW